MARKKQIGKRLQAEIEQAIAKHGNTYAAHLATGIDLATVVQAHRAMTDNHLDVTVPTSPHYRGRAASREPAECGTESGYLKHIRARQAACDDCKSAHRGHRASERERARQAPVGELVGAGQAH